MEGALEQRVRGRGAVGSRAMDGGVISLPDAVLGRVPGSPSLPRKGTGALLTPSQKGAPEA